MGMRGKRGKDKKSTGWIKDTILGFYTNEDLHRDWIAVTPADRIKLLGSWVPKEMKVESDTTISLIINGVRQVQAIDSTPIHELGPGDPDDDETASD